jgi:ATP-dependent helicase/nuclease subunit B
MITVLSGQQGTGKTTELLRRLAASSNGRKTALIVPEQYTYEAEKSVLSLLGKKASFSVSITSLGRIATVANSRYGESGALLTEEAKRFLMKDAVRRVSGMLECYAAISSTDGFCDLCLSLAEEFSRAGASPEEIASLGGEMGAGGPAGKMADLALIYSEYRSSIGGGASDEATLMLRAGEIAREKGIYAGADLYFDGFHSFDRASMALVEAICQKAEGATFALLHSEGPFFATTQRTLEEIQSMASSIGQPFLLEPQKAEKSAPPALRALAGRFSDPLSPPFEGPMEEIGIYEAIDKSDECRFAASQIAKLVEGGMRYSDIAVACPPQSYSDAVRDIFSEYKISFFLDEKREAAGLGPIRAILSLISLLDGPFASEDLIGFAKSGFSEALPQEAMLLENYCGEFGIRKGHMWERPFSRNSVRDPWDLELVNRLREKVSGGAFALRKGMRSLKTAGEKCKAVYLWLEASGFFEKVRALSESYFESGDYEMADAHAQLSNLIVGVFDSFYDFFQDRPLSTREMADLLAYGFSRLRLGLIPARSDRVNVGDVARSRISKVKAIFCLGAVEGAFPASAPPSLLTDAEKEAAGKAGVDLRSTAEESRREAMLSVYATVSKATQRVFLSYPKRGDSGEAQGPAPALSRIAALFPECRTDFGEDAPYLYASREMAVRQMAAGAGHAPGWLYEAFRREGDAISSLSGFTNSASLGGKDEYRKAIASPLATSVSMIEKYEACPFSFFAEYLLRPSPKRKPEFAPTDVGSLLHSIVRRFSRMLLTGQLSASIGEAEARAAIEKIASEEIDASEKLSLNISKAYLGRRVLRAATLSCLAILAQTREGAFALARSEAGFGYGTGLEGVLLSTQEGEALIQGVIDRIDEGEGLVRVIDYKATADFDLARSYHGLSLQLMVYSMAAVRAFGARGAGGMYYMQLIPPLKKIAKEISEDEAKEEMGKYAQFKGLDVDGEGGVGQEAFGLLGAHVQNRIKEAVEGILRGDIQISPYRYKGASACDYCQYRDICFYSEGFEGNKARHFPRLTEKKVFALLEGGDGDGAVD